MASSLAFPVPEGAVLDRLESPQWTSPPECKFVRRACELWEQAGKPDGRDREFYHQAERELEAAQDSPKETPEDI
jgi:hypothetical protein